MDIGANHYRRSNNTYLFYKNGAKGICVEADTLSCRRLKHHRKYDKIINCAVGVEDSKEIAFYILSLPTRSTMDKKAVQESISKGLKVKEVIKLPCISINTLLEQNRIIPDYMSIDIEGMDYKVLRTIDFNKYKIKVIVAEYSDEVIDGKNMNQFMKECGYNVYKETKVNVIYHRKTT